MLQVSVAVVTWEFLKMSLTRPEPYIAYSLVYSMLQVSIVICTWEFLKMSLVKPRPFGSFVTKQYRTQYHSVRKSK